MPDRLHTHTQLYRDQDGTEKPCDGGMHLWVACEDGSGVCTRCGEVDTD